MIFSCQSGRGVFEGRGSTLRNQEENHSFMQIFSILMAVTTFFDPYAFNLRLLTFSFHFLLRYSRQKLIVLVLFLKLKIPSPPALTLSDGVFSPYSQLGLLRAREDPAVTIHITVRVGSRAAGEKRKRAVARDDLGTN